MVSPTYLERWSKADLLGSCSVSLETAGPDYPGPRFSIEPDKLRALAGFLIETCSSQTDGTGGFVTYGFEAAQNYIAGSSNDYLDDMLDLASETLQCLNWLAS